MNVRYTPSDEVLALRQRVAELEAQAEKLKEEDRRLEYRYCCELQMKDQLVDFIRAQGVKVPDRLLRRPY